MTEEFLALLGNLPIEESTALTIIRVLYAILIFAASYLFDLFVKRVLLIKLRAHIRTTESSWDDILIEKRTFFTLSYILPAVIIFILFPMAVPEPKVLAVIVKRVSLSYMIGVFLMTIFVLTDAIVEIMKQKKAADSSTAFLSFAHGLKIVLFFIGSMAIFGILVAQAPTRIFTDFDSVTKEILQGFIANGMKEGVANIVLRSLYAVAVVFLSVAANYVTKNVIMRIIHSITEKTATKLDDILVENKVFERLSHIAPVLVLYYVFPVFVPEPEALVLLVKRLALAYLLGVAALVSFSLIDAGGEIYKRSKLASTLPIRGYLQLGKIFISIIAAILIIGTLINKSPLVLLSGIGALTAVLLLVFKDTLLGLVASFQIHMNKMVNIGDWIEVPQYGADGDVIDMSLHTVKVQNFDKTIVNLPTHALVAGSFRNWRGMLESGGRRIKRSIIIDMQSVRFLSDEMIEKFHKYEFLKDYIEKKKKELDEYNLEHDTSEIVNGRRLTNLGTFRAYIKEYLRAHPKIEDEGMTFLVRQMDPTPNGVPIEVYVFCRDTNWINYESIQSDIFDHILAAVGEFGLCVFQNPSGADVKELSQVFANNKKISIEDGNGAKP